MCGKFHTPLQIVQVRVIISCQKCDSENGCFRGKNGLTKTVAAAKVTNFFELFSIFEFMMEEAKNFRKLFRGLAHDKRIIAFWPSAQAIPALCQENKKI